MKQDGESGPTSGSYEPLEVLAFFGNNKYGLARGMGVKRPFKTRVVAPKPNPKGPCRYLVYTWASR